MHNKKDILKILNEYNYFIDEQVLSSFIKNWKIDPIYEDEDGVEFFDNLALVKLKKGISLKSQGYDNEKIIYYTNKILAEKHEAEVKKEVEVKSEEQVSEDISENVNAVAPVAASGSGELKNFTIDLTSQTLQLLADALAQKITNEIKQNSELFQPVLEDKALKEDNEVLAKKVDELLEDNQKLAKRVEQLEKKRIFRWVNFERVRKFFK